MPMKPMVVLFGGNGFLGQNTAQLLLARGYRVRLVSRRAMAVPSQANDLEYICADALDPSAVIRAVHGADAVVNLIGILMPDKRQNFDQAHKQAAEMIARSCRDHHVPCFVHVSAIGADKESVSHYAQSKAAGEEAVRGAMPDAVILRPSIIFGTQDGFFNRFAAMARFSPILPLIGHGKTLFQPVYVGDVTMAILAALEGRARKGVIYELGGPEQKSFTDLITFMLRTIKKNRVLMNLPFPVAHFVGWTMETLNKMSGGRLPPLLMMTQDQVALLRYDNVVSSAAFAEGRSLQGLGIVPQGLSPIVENYLCQ